MNSRPRTKGRFARRSVEERLRDLFVQGPDDECWPWLGFKRQGYGGFAVTPGVVRQAHRLVYELLVGPIPDDLPLDHQCHNRDHSCPGGMTCPHRACVNPAHLEPVTTRTNLLRGRTITAMYAQRTHCPKGHELAGENLATGPWRRCRECANAWRRAKVRADPGWTARHTPRSHCSAGHELSEDNLRVRTDGARICKICERAAARTREARRKLRRVRHP